MTWDDIEDILNDGSPEEIMSIRCSECGGILSYYYQRYDDGEADFNLSCEKCKLMSKGYLGALHEPPGCVELFGDKARIDKDLKLKKTA